MRRLGRQLWLDLRPVDPIVMAVIVVEVSGLREVEPARLIVHLLGADVRLQDWSAWLLGVVRIAIWQTEVDVRR